MAEAATWQIAPEHLDESVQALREYTDEEGASVLVSIEGEWLPMLELDDDKAEVRSWEGVAEGIGVEGACSTTLSCLPGVKPGDVRLRRDEEVDGLIISIGDRPVLAIAGPELREIPEGLLHLEGADLSLQALRNVSASARGQALLSLDVGGNEELCTVESPTFVELFPELRELSLSDFEELTDLAPLGKLSALTHLHLDGCRRLGKLAPLAELSKLSSLDLSGCERLEDLTPLTGLPLEGLSLEACARLPDLAPLAGIVSLRELDLSGCENLESIAPLRSCRNLEVLRLTGSPKIEDVHLLSECASLRSLEVDDEVLAARVLASAAVKRVDASSVEQNIGRWLALLDDGSEREELLEALLPALALGKSSPWAVDALESVVERARGMGIENRSTWQLVLDTLLAAGDPEFRRGMELAVAKLPPGVAPGPIVGPALDVLARVPKSATKWAWGLGDAVLDSLLTTPRAGAVAADAVKYYARTGRAEALDRWLELVTQHRNGAGEKTRAPKSEPKPEPPSIEDDPAALSGLVARLVQKQPDSPPVAQLVAALVGLAREQPDTPMVRPFAEHFVRLVREQPDSESVSKLSDAFALALVELPDGVPARRLAGQMAELVKMQPEHPLVQALMAEILALVTERPDSPVVTPIKNMLDAARDAGVGAFARQVLEHDVLRRKADGMTLEAFASTFDGREARRALIRGLIDKLCGEDILRNKPRNEIVAALEKDLVDID